MGWCINLELPSASTMKNGSVDMLAMVGEVE